MHAVRGLRRGRPVVHSRAVGGILTCAASPSASQFRHPHSPTYASGSCPRCTLQGAAAGVPPSFPDSRIEPPAALHACPYRGPPTKLEYHGKPDLAPMPRVPQLGWAYSSFPAQVFFLGDGVSQAQAHPQALPLPTFAPPPLCATTGLRTRCLPLLPSPAHRKTHVPAALPTLSSPASAASPTPLPVLIFCGDGTHGKDHATAL